MAIGLGVTFKTACLSLGPGSASSPPYTYIYVSIFLGSTCAARTPTRANLSRQNAVVTFDYEAEPDHACNPKPHEDPN